MTPLFDAVVRFVVAMLFNGLWEAALLALAAWIALRAMPNANATTRHAVLAAALFASLILPAATAWIATVQPSGDVAPASTVGALHSTGNARPPAIHASASTPAAAPATPTSVRAPWRPNLTLPRFLAVGLVALWLLGVVVVLARLIASLLYLERLKRDALPVPIEYRARLERWTRTTKGSRPVRLCRSSEIVIPIAVGLFDAMILVPDHLLEELEPKDVDAIVLHELAHLRRADDWINAVERLAQALLFFNPGIIWLVGQLDLEREVACDDWVLLQDEALPYATCLAKVVETTIWPYRAMSAPGAFVTRRAMSVRIERLLSKHRNVGVSASLGPTTLVVAALVALCIALAAVSPSFAYATAAPPVVAARAPAAAPRPGELQTHVQREILTPVHTAVKSIERAHLGAATKVAATTNGAATTSVAAVAAATTRVTSKAVAQALSISYDAPGEVVSAAPGAATVAANSQDYVDELAGAGYTGLSVDELVQLRAVGVTADFIKRLAAAGIVHPPVRDLVSLRALGVDPAFVTAARARFGSSTSVSDIVSLKAVGVTDAYADELSGAGLKDLSLRQVRNLRALGVTPDYVRDLARAGYPNLSAHQLEQLRALGIDAAYVQLVASHGFRNLTVEQLIRLKASGVIK